MKFTKISQSTFEEIQVNAGMLLKDFDPEEPEFAEENIICATTGGINITASLTMGDWGSDIDNCPNKMKELAFSDSWETGMSFTALNVSEEMLKIALGVADIDSTTGKVTPRRDLKQSDFINNLWWVGDRSDGGFVAARVLNALSTGGLSLQTTKNGKGQLAVTIGGHFSIFAQDVVPIEFYVSAGDDEPVIGPGVGGTKSIFNNEE